MEAATAHAKVPKVIETIAAVLGEFCEQGPTDEELARAKRRHRMFLEFSLDSCAELAGWFGGTELWRPAETFAERIARIEAVTAADLRRVASKVLARKNLHLVLVGRGGTRAEAKLRRQCSELPLPL